MAYAVLCEIDGAMDHPMCQAAGPFTAMPIINFPHKDAPKAASYFRSLPPDRPRCIKLARAGVCWGYTERMEGKPEVMIGPTAEQIGDAYTSGTLDFRRSVNWPGLGGGRYSDFADAVTAIGLMHDGGVTDFTVYIDFEGQLGADVQHPASQRAAGRMYDAPNFRAALNAAYPGTGDIPRDDFFKHLVFWDKDFTKFCAAFDYVSRSILNSTFRQYLDAAGHRGPFAVWLSSCPASPVIGANGRYINPSLLRTGQIANHCFYGDGRLITASALGWRLAHACASRPAWAHFNAHDPIPHLAERIAYLPPAATGTGNTTAGAASILWGNPNALGALGELAQALTALPPPPMPRTA